MFALRNFDFRLFIEFCFYYSNQEEFLTKKNASSYKESYIVFW